MANKIVILTGSYNPPSLAHLETIVSAMDIVGADKGYMVPTSYRYLYEKMSRVGDGFVLSDELRKRMLSAVCSKDSRLVVGTTEKEYSTYFTISDIKAENPGALLYFIVGADKLPSLPNWDNAEALLSSTKIIVFGRENKDAESLIHANRLLNKYEQNFIILPALSSNADVSSTRVRELFMDGNTEYRKLVLPEVADILETAYRIFQG